MSGDYYKKEIEKIEEQLKNLEQEFIKSLKESIDKINNDIKANNQKNKDKIKTDTEKQIDKLSKSFNDIQSLEIKRREIMLEKFKENQSKINEKFKNTLNSFIEKLFGQERSKLSNNQNINKFLKDMIKIEQDIILVKNENTFNIILDDLSIFQLSTKYYQSSNMPKFFLKSIDNNFKFLESIGNFQDMLEYVDGVINLSEKIVENKADILYKYSMKLFKEGKFNDAKKNLEIALKTTRDKKGKIVLQLELDKVTLTSMHINVRNFKKADFEEAIKICDRMLNSPFIKDKNREKINIIKNFDMKKLEELKNKNKNNVDNNIGLEINKITFTLGDE